jgi:replication-associated recombination protein RarA
MSQSIETLSWYKKHEPKTIEEYVFENEDYKEKVINWLKNETIPGNILLYGPAGTGKSALSKLLILSIIKNQFDLNKVEDKSAANIDTLHNWCQKKPIASKKKIIYIEEFDRMHSAAFNSLKDGLMEKYQEYVSFVCTTNHLNRIESAVKTRFNFIFNLNSKNIEGTITRLSSILQLENITFNQEELKLFVDNNIQIGLRQLITALQVNSKNNIIDFQNIKLQKSEFEDIVIQQTLKIINILLELKTIKDKINCFRLPLNSQISAPYSTIIETINYNQDINYETIFEEINNKTIQFLPILTITNKYLSTLENKKLPNIHFMAYISEIIQCLVEVNL